MIFRATEKQKEEARKRLNERLFAPVSDEEYYAALLNEYCRTCGRTKNAEDARICSNSFHLTIPDGYVMKDGRLELIDKEVANDTMD